ncbi:MAG: hypothetical protein MNPFHGCM_00905 [Gemmatimonadaceae bacterium]|nr:hypothetical protein [Gemmatimonadaceae bacterium]
MDLRFDAAGQMVSDLATAVAWRLDPDRPPRVPNDPRAREAIARVFVTNVARMEMPPRLSRQVEPLREAFPTAVSDLLGFIALEHIYAAVHSEMAASIQHPGRAPFLIIDDTPQPDAILVDIGAMIAEYREALRGLGWERMTEDAIKKIIGNSITPRFDGVDVRLEEISRKLDAGFKATASNQQFEELIAEIRKLQPPHP